MTTVDSISNLLTVLRNAVTIKKALVSIPYTTTNFEILKILESQGFIHCSTVTDRDSFGSYSNSSPESVVTQKNWGRSPKLIIIALKYIGREKKPIIHSLKRISKPSIRYYLPNPIPKSLGGLGIFITSTSLGIMTDKEARTKKLGGEILVEIW